MEEKKTLNTQLLGMTMDELPRVSLKGTRVVRKQNFSQLRDVILTIRPDGIIFNNACIVKMEGVNYIHIIIDEARKLLIVRACDENDRDSQRWCNVKEDLRKNRKITGRPFSTELYRMMEWCKGFYYKTIGTPALQLDKEDELLLVFELSEAEQYAMTEKGRLAAGVIDEEDLGEYQEDIKTLDNLRKIEEAEALAEGRKPRRIKLTVKDPSSLDIQSFGVIFDEHENRIEIPRLEQLMMLSDFVKQSI